jgi:hypothetical protein
LADNVVQITVTSKNSTRAGFQGAKADAEAAATGIAAIFDKMGKNVNKHLSGLGSGLGAAGGILGAGSGLLAMAAPLGAAGLALGAFGAIAIPVLSKVHAAQVKLTAAQLQYSKATTAAGRATALKAEQQATAGLTDQQKGLMGQVAALGKQFSRLEAQMTPVIVAVASMVIQLGGALMPVLATLATAGAKLITGMLRPLLALISSPFFAQFTKQIAAMAVQMGPVLGAAVAGLLKWLMQLFIAVMPAGLKILKLLLPALLVMLTELIPVIAVTAQVVAVILKWLGANKLLVPALWLLVGAFVAMKLALLSNPIFLIGAAIAVLAFLVVKYHKQIWEFIVRIWHDIIGFLVRTWNDFLGFAKKWWPLIFGVAGLIVVYHNQIWAFIVRIWGDIIRFFKRTWDDIGKAFKAGVRYVVDRFLDMAGWIVHAAASAFGWIPGIGPKLKDAAKAFDKFRDNVNAALGGVNGRTVHVGVDMTTATGGAGGGQRTNPRGFAGGTAGAAPGWSWVGEEGPELVHMQGGETVVPHGQSVQMTRGYARGVGVVTSAPSLHAVQGAVNAAVDAIARAFARSLAAVGAIGGIGGSGVARWAPVILRSLGMLGQSSANLGAVEHRMNQESGGNQFAINRTDINAQRGDPSRGLMQVIGATFARYRSWILPANIYDPMANTFAGLNYAVNSPGYRGRSLASVMMQPGGYRGGTGGRMSPLRVEIVFRTTGTTDLDRALMSWLKKAAVSNGGGNVQAAFGSG